MLVTLLLQTAIVATSPASFPDAGRIARDVADLGWERDGTRLSDERHAMSFPVERRLGVVRRDGVSAEVTIFSKSRGGTEAVGVELLLWDSAALRNGAAISRVLVAAGVPLAAREATLDLVARRASSTADEYPAMASSRLSDATGLAILTRSRISRGPGGESGHFLFQFVSSGSERLGWPTIQEVAALQPIDRATMLTGNSDVPAVLRPNVSDLACRPLPRARLTCSYALTIDDWIGPNRPRSRVRDVFERDGRGGWRMVVSEPR